MPFHRLQHLQKLCGTPLAASTAWHQCEAIWLEGGEAVYEALLTLAAQSKLLHVDDTGAKILSMMAKNKNLSPPKKGCHTTLVRGKTANEEEMVVYLTGPQTAGYKLGSILTKRQFPHHRLNLMSDASTMNTIRIEGKADQRFLAQLEQGYCLSHGQRKFKDLLAFYPEECSYFIKQIQGIYHEEHLCQDLSPRQRLAHHKHYSTSYIKAIYSRIEELFASKKVEPNSSLGKAMRYWLTHREKLTKFLHVRGMPLDNNPAEEGLRSIILQRKNSYFFKTPYSARVLSGLHSLVKTCEVNGINSFGYLNWLQEQGEKVILDPAAYLPFQYQKVAGTPGQGPPLQLQQAA